MTLLKMMQERIRTAVAGTESIDEDMVFEEVSASINNKLQAINERGRIPHRGATEEVFPLEDVADVRDFVFTRIVNRSVAKAFIEALRCEADPSEQWPFDKWLLRSVDQKKTVLAVHREGDLGFAGFAVVGTNLAVEDHDMVELSPTLYLSVDLAAVYVLPKHRGEGFSTALAWAAGKLVDSVVDHLTEMPPEDREPLLGLEFEIFIRGEAHSAAGARYLASAVEEIESNMEFYDPEDDWLLHPTVTDDVDFSDFPCCGYGERYQKPAGSAAKVAV